MNFKSCFSALFIFFSFLGGEALAQEQKTEYLLIYNGESFAKILTQPGDPGSFSEPCEVIKKRDLAEECNYQGFLVREKIADLIQQSDLSEKVLKNSGVDLQNTTGFQVVSIPPDDFNETYRLATGGESQSQPEQEEAESRDRPEMIEDKYLAKIPSPERIRHLGGWGSEEKPLLIVFIDKDGEETYYQSKDSINPRLKVSKATGIPPSYVELIRMSEIDHAHFGSYAITQER